MPSKYPSLAFTARDVQDLMAEIKPHVVKLEVNIEWKPSKLDPARLRISCCVMRRSYQIGDPPTALAEKYVPGKAQASLDKAVFEVLWALLQELEVPSATWGRYTELAPGFPRSPKR